MTREFTIANHHGIHARPAAMFAKVSNACNAEVRVEKDGEVVNGKSIMGLMLLAVGQGSKIRITVEGTEAAVAMAQIEELIASGFGES